jgi:transcriptional regulator of acetoin/glycerol metabolism
MEKYRALCGITGSGRLHPSSLDGDEVLQLPGLREKRGARVFVLKTNDLALLAADAPQSGIIDRGIKHPAKPLAHYLSARTGLVRLRADYQDPGQAERGIRALLTSTQTSDNSAIYFVGIGDTLFEQLWSRAEKRTTTDPPNPLDAENWESPDLQVLLHQNPNLQVPDTLQRAFLGVSTLSDRVRRLVVLASKVSHPVLVQGETGTGKEVVAQMIHRLSSRSTESFVVVNCGGIPTDLLESELFGHVQGAFTGALRNKTGLWTLADAGTLFLDEISDLTPPHQVKVLRALEGGSYRAVGGEDEIHSGARIVAATNRDLQQMVDSGKFREDLYYRLFTFRIRTPALCQHLDDIPELAAHFWRRLAQDRCAPLPVEALQELKTYSWPGNARELRSFLINVATVADGRPVSVHVIRAVMRDRFGRAYRSDQDQ